MRTSSRRIDFVVAYIAIAGGLWTASQWWEKGLAENLGDPTISPNGCYRIEAFKPFWVLPNMLHRKPHPDDEVKPKWFPWWKSPTFFRLYDHRNGELISETKIYDLESAGGRISWGGATREVAVGMIYIGPNAPDCIDDQPTARKSKE
jgi:hypothetical protein